MQGVPVRGTISDIPELVRKYHILEIVIAITTVKGDRLSEIINLLQFHPLPRADDQ